MTCRTNDFGLNGVGRAVDAHRRMDKHMKRVGRTVAALRDRLLPNLISGELPVKDVEPLVGEAME